jgi:hypothetical protein
MSLGPEHGLVLVIKPDTNAPSPPDDIYCLLRVPTTDPGLLDFVGRSKKYLRHRAVGCFAITEALDACHSLPQYDKQLSKIGSGGGCTFHTPSNNFLQRALCARFGVD